jgi:hypothetical protein
VKEARSRFPYITRIRRQRQRKERKVLAHVPGVKSNTAEKLIGFALCSTFAQRVRGVKFIPNQSGHVE